MQNINSFLVDWAIKFLENRDVIKRNILDVKKNKEGFDFVVNYKDNSKYFIVKVILEDVIFDILKNSKGIFGTPKIAKRFSSEIKNKDNIGIVTLNNKENIRFVVSKWEKLAGMRFLTIYFINPFSNLDKAWILRPYVHDKICDKSSLELGLKSMSEMVEMIGKLELEQKIKSKKEESGL